MEVILGLVGLLTFLCLVVGDKPGEHFCLNFWLILLSAVLFMIEYSIIICTGVRYGLERKNNC